MDIEARARALWPGSLVIPGLASVLIARSVMWEPADADDRHRQSPQGRAWPASAEDVSAALTVPSGSAATHEHEPRTHHLGARYDGPDLAVTANRLGLTPAQLVARHVSAWWTVAAVGFSPGFGYLTCPDPVFAAVERRSDPRRRVPTGSIALAAGLCAVYPSPTPGGWQLIGSTDAVLWDPSAVPPGRLRVGDVVRFEAT